MNNAQKVVVFDLDGVIIDSIDLMFELTKGEFPDIDRQDLRDLHRQNIHEALKTTTLRRKEETPEEKEERHLAHNQNKLNVLLYPGIEDLLSKLAQTYTLVINTSSSDRSTLPILKKNNIEKYFAFVATKDVSTNKVEKFTLIAEKFGTTLGELLFITDSVGDVKEAGVAGVPTIVVTWGVHTKEDFKEVSGENILAFVDTPEELLAYIEGN